MFAKFIIMFLLIFFGTFSVCTAGESFKYNFEKNDTILYIFKMNSRLKLLEYESLARLFNLENINHNVNINIDLITESIDSDNNTTIKAIMRKVSAVLIAGDSVYLDDGTNWGAVKPGSEYSFVITPKGEIIDFTGPDSTITKQGVQTIQRFFPIFPSKSIDTGYSWVDSLSFELVFPDGKPAEIRSQLMYRYDGIKVETDNNIHQFGFQVDGLSDDSTGQFSGEGSFYFNKKQGRIVKNSGNYNINANIDLAAFGLPKGLGSDVPVNIKSEIITEINNDR